MDFLVRARALAEPEAVGKVSGVDGRDPELAGRRGDVRQRQFASEWNRKPSPEVRIC